MAQELLCRTTFRFDRQEECPSNLKGLSFDIARKCDGLPLAIVAIEGLVKENEEMTLEDTAKAYLTSLINRSLVQVEWSDSTGRVRSCRAHDLIHEVLLYKLEELNLIQSSQASSNGAARYLWIDNNRASDLSRRNG
ncbi:hypothetical protein V6N13_088546 [Hibiscus sabdariffa]